jgi:hypothetical protein
MKKIYAIIIFFSAITCSYAQTSIKGYEYWFNDDFANKTTTSTASTQQLFINHTLPTAGLANGMNVINFRSFDNAGKYSSVASHFFYKASASETNATPEIVAYQYWMNNEYNKAVVVNNPKQAQVTINELIPTGSLNNGLHTFNIRFKDNKGIWSSVMSHLFYKASASETNATPEIVAYQYWLDNEYGNAVVVNNPKQAQATINELIPTGSLNNGVHNFNIRFKDNKGIWSSVMSHLFYKTSEQTATQNRITEYRYWFNDGFNQATHVVLPSPVSVFDLASNLNLAQMQVGSHTIHFQFKDELGKWSVVTSDAIEKTVTLSIIDNTFGSNILAYPNPTNGKVFVDFGESLNAINVHIHTINGKLVQQAVYNNKQTLEFDFTEPPGIYLLTISSGNKRTTIKLIKN